MSQRIPSAGVLVLTAREVALLAYARSAIVERWRVMARGTGMPMPEDLTPLLEALAQVAREAGLDLTATDRAGTEAERKPTCDGPPLLPPVWVSVAQAAQRLEVTERWVRGAVVAGHLVGRRRHGRAWEIDAETVEQYRVERAKRRRSA